MGFFENIGSSQECFNQFLADILYDTFINQTERENQDSLKNIVYFRVLTVISGAPALNEITYTPYCNVTFKNDGVRGDKEYIYDWLKDYAQKVNLYDVLKVYLNNDRPEWVDWIIYYNNKQTIKYFKCVITMSSEYIKTLYKL